MTNATKIVMQWKRVEVDSGYYCFLNDGVRDDLFYVWHLEKNKRVLRMRRGEKKKTQNSEMIFWFIQEIAGSPV